MARIDGSITIERPIEEVFEYMHSLENDPKWQPQVVESSADGPLGVGTTLTYKRKIMGREVESKAEVVAYDPPHKSTVRSEAGPVTFEGTYQLEQTNGGTRVAFSADVEPSGILKIAAGAFASQIQKEFETNLKQLKAMLEGRI